MSIAQSAIKEFDQLMEQLTFHDVAFTVFEDTPFPVKPDAVFPNNWFSTFPDGTLALYPMHAPVRRLERSPDIVSCLKNSYPFRRVIDLSDHENHGQFLEGTGSMVIDHEKKIAYACRSVRTNAELMIQLCGNLGYTPLLFDAEDENGFPVYHTNVMMNLGEGYAVVCLQALKDKQERNKLRSSLDQSGLSIIEISQAQMAAFAGNMLMIRNRKQEALIFLSQTALQSLLPKQQQALSTFGKLIPVQLPTIERIGGGSLRCMMAEIFL